MRKAEILRLRKHDINFKERKIYVQSVKNNKNRIIDIDFKLVIILYFYCRKLNSTDLLFNLKSSYVSIYFHKIMQKSDLQKITFHDMRHIHASFLLSKLRNNANAILIVSKRLGHSNVIETLTTYAHTLSLDDKKIVHHFNFI